MCAQPTRSNRRNIATVLRVFSPHASSRRLPFCRGHTRAVFPKKRGCENFPTMSTSAPLGSPGSAEYDPMRTGKLVVVSARV
jgi:hypothetical protein